MASSEATLEQVKEAGIREAALQAEQVEKQQRETRELQSKVDEMLMAIDGVGRGDYSKRIELSGNDSVSRLGQHLQHFFDDKRQGEEQEQARIAAEAKRQQGRDRAPAGVGGTKGTRGSRDASPCR
ncbi:MAG: hypothetical protein R3B96_14040 [Pirellulaceae bacterium]